jgi:undecaprenyl diphosphate synthase
VTNEDLKHIAFIMDGNRRWAKKNGLPVAAGHKKGAETLIKIVEAVKDIGIPYVSVYAFSTENWQRDKSEVDTLMGLLRHYLDTGFNKLQENNVKIRFIGEREMLAADIREKMARIEADTEQNNAVTLCVALSYGGRQEIVSAVRKAAELAVQGKLAISEITVENFNNCLYTKDIPDPDLLIRTSGECRLSNFLLWQSAYTELFFSDTLWPDFTKEELNTIVKEFNTRERRYGRS